MKKGFLIAAFSLMAIGTVIAGPGEKKKSKKKAKVECCDKAKVCCEMSKEKTASCCQKEM